MSQLNAAQTYLETENKRFMFAHETIRFRGFYGPYEPIKGREIAWIAQVESTIPERVSNTHVTPPPYKRTGHLRPALEAFESLCMLEDYWGVCIFNVVSELLYEVLPRYGYRLIKDGEIRNYYKPVQKVGLQISQLNDLKEFSKRKLESEFED